LAVVDLSQLLGTSRQLATAPPRTLVLDTSNGNLAVPVGEVRAVVWLDREQLRPVHATSLPYMKAEFEDGDTVTPVLDLAEVLASISTEDGHGSRVGL
jgi:chemotaxis signal transduction protein